MPEEELLGAYQVWERLELLAPDFGTPREVLTLEKWHVQPGDVVDSGASLARIARSDGTTIEQRATERMRVLEVLIPEGGLMESKSRMVVLGPVSPDATNTTPGAARSGCATFALGIAATLLVAFTVLLN